MVTALILAAGVGQRMRNGGLPKQFLKLMGKPIVVYTIEKFEHCEEINSIIIVCHGSYIEHMEQLVRQYGLKKVAHVIVGGADRQASLVKGLNAIEEASDGGDIVLIHDGVRPLVSESTIRENIRSARRYGCAITVHPVIESVVITDGDEVTFQNFKKRADTYSLTSPQTFRFEELRRAFALQSEESKEGLPLLDAAMVHASVGGTVHLVKEHNTNIKITTPEDFYYLKAILDLEESKYIFGL